MELQKITYTAENSTPEIIQAIRSRVQYIGDQIISIHEVPKVSPFTVKIIYEEIHRLSQDWDHIDFISDVRDSQRHDTDARKAYEYHFNGIKDRVGEIVLILGGNFIIRASTTFILRSTGRALSKICGSIEEGVAFIKSKRTAL